MRSTLDECAFYDWIREAHRLVRSYSGGGGGGQIPG